MLVVGTMFFKNQKLLIDKPRKRNTYQMIGGGVEEGETPLMAAIRECYEELGNHITLDPNAFELIMDFDEIATSDPNKKIHFYVFEYKKELNDEPINNEEIEKFMWYDSSQGEEILSNTLKHEVVPYCLKKGKIK